MAPTPEPYRIFNDSLRTEPATAYLSTFSPFPRLPPEIQDPDLEGMHPDTPLHSSLSGESPDGIAPGSVYLQK